MTQPMHIRAVRNKDELAAATKLMTAVHAHESDAAREWIEDAAPRYPGYQRAHTRAVFVGPELVSALHVLTDTLALGEARLRMAGLAWVGTADHRRGRGYGRALVEDTLAYLQDHRFHLCMLFGIPGFWRQFGFVTTLADYTVDMDTLDALTFANGLRIREAKPGDIAAMARLHTHVTHRAACAVVRSQGHFSNRWQRWTPWHVLTTEDGQVVAYFTAHPEGTRLRIDDAALAGPELAPALIYAAGTLASAASLSGIRLCVPPEHPLSRCLLQFRSTHATHIDRDAGGMMAWVDLAECLESMAPEFERLVSLSPLKDANTELTLIVEGKSFVLRFHRGSLALVPGLGRNKISLRPDHLMHALTGFRYSEDILAEARGVPTAELRELMRVLFPKRHPYMWPVDRF